jgi:hypothetical protein
MDPSATLAVHCGNGFDAGSAPFRVDSSWPRQLPYGEGTKKNENKKTALKLIAVFLIPHGATLVSPAPTK